MHDAALVFRTINLVAYPALGLVTFVYWRRRRDAASMWAAATFGSLGLLELLGLDPEPPRQPRRARRRPHRHRAARALPVLALPLHDRLPTTASRRLANALFSLTAILVVWTFALPRIPQPGEPRPASSGVRRRLHRPLDGALDRLRAHGSGAPDANSRPSRGAACSSSRSRPAGLTSPSCSPSSRLRAVLRPRRSPPASSAPLSVARVPARLRAAARSSASGGARRRQARLQQAIASLAHLRRVAGGGGVAGARAGRRDRRRPRDRDPQRRGHGRRRLERAGRRLGEPRTRRGSAARSGPTRESSISRFRAAASSCGRRRTRRSSATRSSRCSGRSARSSGLALDRVRLFQAEHETRLALERANEVKSNFVALAAHELRTPMTTIHGFVTTLHHLSDRLDDEPARAGARGAAPADAAHGHSGRAAARSLAPRRGGDRHRSRADRTCATQVAEIVRRRAPIPTRCEVDDRATTRLRSSTASHSSAS